MTGVVLNVVSGAPSGALNVTLTVAEYLKKYYQSDIVLRKYNKANVAGAKVIKDRLVVDYIWRLHRYLKGNKADAIIAHGYSTHLWTKIAAAIHHIPVIHVEHNMENYTSFRRWMLKRLDKFTHTYVCVSQGVSQHLIAQGICSDKVRVLYNGINIEKFKVKKDPGDVFTIGMTARFSKQKDQITLIKAVEYLMREGNLQVHLILQGDGKTRRKCIEYVERNNLQESIKFETGLFTDLARKIDLFVLSTNYEGFGLVVCEAMAAGLPVIASDVVGVNEIIDHGVNGFLVPRGDYKKLAEQIADLYERRSTPEIQLTISRGSETVVNKFSFKGMNNEYRKLVSEILGSGRDSF